MSGECSRTAWPTMSSIWLRLAEISPSFTASWMATTFRALAAAHALTAPVSAPTCRSRATARALGCAGAALGQS